MSAKSERLLELMDLFRQHRRPVTAARLAELTGTSVRTVYRDLDSLRALGMAIDGAPGVGLQLRGEVFLPPLTLSSDEMEAVALGLRGQIQGPDAALAGAARAVLAKITDVLPEERRRELQGLGLFALPGPKGTDANLALIRQSLREERAMHLRYRDGAGQLTERVIWPVAMGYLLDRQDLVAWCTLRSGFRRFVTERMERLDILPERIGTPRRTLFHDWLQDADLPDLT